MPGSGMLKVTTPNDREIVMTRVLNAPRRLVFQAWTTPHYIQRWMLGPEGWTMPVCELDLRPGGEWHFVWRKDDGTEMSMSGVYKEVKPPERLVSTERWGPEWPEALNTLVLTEENGKTTVTITVTYVSKEVRDAALKTGMADGMAITFDRLEKVLGTMGEQA